MEGKWTKVFDLFTWIFPFPIIIFLLVISNWAVFPSLVVLKFCNGSYDIEEGAEGEESDEEDAGEDVDVEGEDEEDSDLDLAWKMLESARVILDKQEDTVEKVDVISALGDVSLERGRLIKLKFCTSRECYNALF